MARTPLSSAMHAALSDVWYDRETDARDCTLAALLRRGLIQAKPAGFGGCIYELTEAGRVQA
jgi:hypothetical protein